jgi:hypothetical protein
MSSYRGLKCGSGGYAVRAKELATWLSDSRRLGKPQVFKDGAEALKQISGVKGVVFIRQFKGYVDRDYHFDHIDVWNGSQFGSGLTQYFDGHPSYVWFWPMK